MDERARLGRSGTQTPNGRCGSRRLISRCLWALALLTLFATNAWAESPGQPGAAPRPTLLWEAHDPALEADLQTALSRLGLADALQKKQLSVALVDVSRRDRPRVAALNGDDMFYAASLPKIAVMLAVFEKEAAGELEIDGRTWEQLVRMIRASSNGDSTQLMHKVTKPYIASVLRRPRYGLYDPARGGGLWAGKDYASQGLWRRDPVHNLSHGATAMQVARFFYLLDQGRLVDAHASKAMKRLLADSAIEHKFVKGIHSRHPEAAIYRKSGTWRHYHADGALIEREDGARYIAVGLAESPDGGRWLQELIVSMDGLIPAQESGALLAPVGAGG